MAPLQVEANEATLTEQRAAIASRAPAAVRSLPATAVSVQPTFALLRIGPIPLTSLPWSLTKYQPFNPHYYPSNVGGPDVTSLVLYPSNLARVPWSAPRNQSARPATQVRERVGDETYARLFPSTATDDVTIATCSHLGAPAH